MGVIIVIGIIITFMVLACFIVEDDNNYKY